jgi:hypothetical protein
MAASHKKCLSPKYRILVQDIEHELAVKRAAPVEKVKRAEHMFNMLNSRMERGKNSPMVCKILSRMSAIRHGFELVLLRRSYLLEKMGLRNCVFQPVGLRIAFSMARPAFLGIRSGKDGL